MSENNKENQEVSLLQHDDFTMKDMEAIEKFKENGMLGLHTLSDTDVERMMSLYMSGKSYRQIAAITKRGKPVILFLAHKFKWFELRQDYLAELQITLKNKVVEAKLTSQEFFLDLSAAYQKKINSCVENYLRTDERKFADQIDVKDVNTLIKITELIHKLNTDDLNNPNDKALVGLNGLGDGVTITQTGQHSVEITPKVSAFSTKLKQFAELKRKQEKDEAPGAKKLDDIIIDQTQTEKEDK